MSYIHLTRNPVPIRCATANHTQPDFRFEVEVRTYDAFGNVSTRVRLKGLPDAAGNFTFNVSPVLESVLEAARPELTQTGFAAHSGALVQWAYDIEQWWQIDPLLPAGKRETYTSEAYSAILGGLSFLRYPGSDYFGENPLKFLSWAPAEKLVSASQPEFLHFVRQNTYEFATLSLWAKVYYADGTSWQGLISSANPEGKLISVQAGFQALGLDQKQPTKTPRKYELWLTPDANASSAEATEKRTYLLDEGVYPEQRLFLYQNSLGGYEVLRCTGESDEAWDVSAEQAERVLSDEYTRLTAQFMRMQTSAQEVIKANTGRQISQAWYNHLKEFFLSNDVYEILPQNQLVPIVLKPARYTLKKAGDFELAADFEYSYAHTTPNYSA